MDKNLLYKKTIENFCLFSSSFHIIMIQQPSPSYNFTITRAHNVPTQTKLHTTVLPSILIGKKMTLYI